MAGHEKLARMDAATPHGKQDPAELIRADSRPPRSIPLLRPDLIFWFCFVALNLLLFAPAYLVNLADAALWPWAASSSLGTGNPDVFWLFWRENPDPFRLNLELVLLIALWATWPALRRPWLRRVITGTYLFTLLYFVYDAVFRGLYLAEPVLYSQARMLTDGLAFVVDHVRLPLAGYLGLAVGLVVVVGGVLLLLRGLLQAGRMERLHPASRVVLALLVAGVLVGAAVSPAGLAEPEAEVASLTAKLERNLRASAAMYRTVHAYDDSAIRRVYNFTGRRLAARPNIYLIFVESYGSVLYKRPDWQVAHPAFLRELEDELAADGWRAASTISEAPTWGGGSWMSYTSALFGVRIDADPQFMALLERYQEEPYPDLGRWLQSQGYRYYRLSSIAGEMKPEVFDQYWKFYGVDEWFTYKDLGYVGPRYGWGPAPPDQYALNWARDRIQRETRQPYFFFTITQNSHYPWAPLPALAEDWRSLNVAAPDPDPGQPELIEHSLRRENYLNAVAYELRTLVDFVRTEQDEDALFILIGDHQPPRVSRRADGWGTPVHFISRDQALLDSLADYGFTSGLVVESPEPTLRHEALYSLLVHVLVSQYGREPSLAPAYLPLGAPFAAGLGLGDGK